MAFPRKLKQRWEVYPTLKDVLKATDNLSVSPFGKTEEGLTDFRGIQLVPPKHNPNARKLEDRFPKVEKIICKEDIKNADFSGSLWFDIKLERADGENVTLENVRFAGSKFDGYYSHWFATVIGGNFDNCVFKGFSFFDLKDCQFTNIKKSSRLDLNTGLVENCLFEGYIYKGMFYTTLKNCKIVGTFYDCRFAVTSSEEPIKYENVDATEANFVICSVWHHDFSELKTSPNTCVVKLTDAFFEAALSLAKAHPTMAETLEKEVKMWLKPHSTKPYDIVGIDNLTALKAPEELSKAYYEVVVKAKEITKA